MKYCLSSRQEYAYLSQVDEIKFEFRDRKAIPDFVSRYPYKKIILKHTINDEEIDWNQISNFNILAKENLYLCTYSVEECQIAKDLGIKFYLGFPISTYYQLNALIELGVSYIRLDAPLFFDLENIKKITNIPIRAVPNVCYIDGFPRKNGIYGTWIRPEDTDAYSQYIDVFEFEDTDLQKERGLFRIYKEQNWPGEFNMLFTNFNVDGVNRMVGSEYSQRRMQCAQQCQNGKSTCKICERLIYLANPELIDEYKKFLFEKEE